MILTGNQIKMARENGWLDISDWDENRLNPNSYNLRLADELMVYLFPPQLPENEDVTLRQCEKMAKYRAENFGLEESWILDAKHPRKTKTFKIPECGHILRPGVLYLGRTMEYTETHKFVPMLEGRSSVGRLGISIHSTAGFGDIGFCGYWTLEISCVQPVRIYPGVEICQIYYHSIARDFMEKEGTYFGGLWIPDDNAVMKYDNGKYQKNQGIQPSMMWKEFQ